MCQSCKEASPKSWCMGYAIYCIIMGFFSLCSNFYGMLFYTYIVLQPKVSTLNLVHVVNSTTQHYVLNVKESSIDIRPLEYVALTVGCVYFIFEILYILAGSFMLVGVIKERQELFFVGKTFSYFWPIFYFYLIFPLTITKIRKHIKRQWP
ncbi:uncharacterized protein Dana_GF26731, isoform B [Drosophila ananassae]|uniref:Uncharacterized protein, isoform B n=1 Tax=Drosophila ananassae TaxID=7217 RepID=A0A0P8Y8S1_DROAN|nr:uncharacterized protein LOC26514140 isoform X2 [Drosophila ananassae]KPU77842.1 uncharacterized protein Dana_GF26731, isoform B [Drosophila ananassae]